MNGKIPERIGRLEELANNLWWSWHPQARNVFRILDYQLWKLSGHNPVRELHQVSPDTLQAAAADSTFLALYDSVMTAFDEEMKTADTPFARSHPELGHSPIAYFSMEYGLASSFYNKFSSSREIDCRNKIQEHEVFSNYRMADYLFTLSMDSIIDLPIYSGGLGVLAGDTVKTMADYKLPAVCVGMLWHSGYFRQKFWFKYGQLPEKMYWDTLTYPGLIPLKNRVKI